MATKQKIEEIADLACLKIEPEKTEGFQAHFEKITQYFDVLETVSTTGVEPMIVPHGRTSPLRSDEVYKDLSVEEVLQNAPDVKDGLFRVPPVV